MIGSFADRDTERLFRNRDDDDYKRPATWRAILDVAVRKLDAIDAANDLRDLSAPGNRLERLEHDRKGQWSIRINKKYRVCFKWTEAGADDVEIVDYH
jgi:toxin HigB-1